MILNKDSDNIITNATGSKEVPVSTHRVIFEIISSHVYENKPKAVVRELACNALDSHTAAGYKDKPFIIHVPDKYNPVFYVEDFGVGLDDVEVNNVYMAAFESTKRNSNDYIGALGIGANSPLSYTSCFEVLSRKNGIEYIHQIFFPEDSLPKTTLISKRPTDKPNGVKVSVPVLEKDIEFFKQEIENVLSWFSVKPTIVGATVNLDTAYDKVSNNIYIKSASGAKNFRVLMGNVIYDAKNFLQHLNTAETIDYYRFITNRDIVIEFPLGELSFGASRETLSLDSKTIDNLKKYIPVYINEFIQSAQKNIDELKNIFDVFAYCVNANLPLDCFTLITYKGSKLSGFNDKVSNIINYSLYTNSDANWRGPLSIGKYRLIQESKSPSNLSLYDFISRAIKVQKKKYLFLLVENKELRTISSLLSEIAANENYNNHEFLTIDKSMVLQSDIDNFLSYMGDYVDIKPASEFILKYKKPKRVAANINRCGSDDIYLSVAVANGVLEKRKFKISEINNKDTLLILRGEGSILFSGVMFNPSNLAVTTAFKQTYNIRHVVSTTNSTSYSVLKKLPNVITLSDLYNRKYSYNLLLFVLHNYFNVEIKHLEPLLKPHDINTAISTIRKAICKSNIIENSECIKFLLGYDVNNTFADGVIHILKNNIDILDVNNMVADRSYINTYINPIGSCNRFKNLHSLKDFAKLLEKEIKNVLFSGEGAEYIKFDNVHGSCSEEVKHAILNLLKIDISAKEKLEKINFLDIDKLGYKDE